MICVTIAKETNHELRAAWQRAAHAGARLVELRLDYLTEPVDWNILARNKPTPMLVTVRRTIDGGRWAGREAERRELIAEATQNGADWVDVEVDVAGHLPRSGISQRVVSFHDMNATPRDLETITDQCRQGDADLIKLAVMAQNLEDALNLLGAVARSHKISPTMGLSMGPWGQFTRVANAKHGVSWTYAAWESPSAPAPGMLSFDELTTIYDYDRVSASTELYAVIGDPVGHSKSPLVHNLAFRSHGLDKLYVPLRIAAGDLAEFIPRMRDWGFQGLSVTIPHKEAIIGLMEEVSPLVRLTGSCNTVYVTTDGRLMGENTDLAAALDSLAEAVGGGPQALVGQQVLLLGAGGVARSLAFGLRQRGAHVVIANRTEARAEELAREADCAVAQWQDRDRVAAESAIIVNATPLGMSPQVDASPLPASAIQPNHIVFDTIYIPEWTRLLQDAKTAGATTLSGVEMFIRQAAEQSVLFTGGLAPPVEAMGRELRKSLNLKS